MTVGEIILFIVQLLAGTGVFLVGVHLLTKYIEQLATSKIKNLFEKTANKKIANVLIGASSTAIVQSSGVTTVLIVGFVNVGVMSLSQATALIMGANIGTTITAQIAALSAFNFTTYVQVLAGIGIIMTMVSKSEKVRNVGFIISGLGLIFIGLAIMSSSMEVNRSAIQDLFTKVQNPVLLLVIGIALTALVQSSSATTSVIIAMSVAGLTIGKGGNEVLFIILGTNIGSCVTALMSSLGANANARRSSLIHLMFNTFGSALFFILLICIPSFMEITFKRWFSAPATQIAMFHTFFNVTCTVLFLPASELFVKISRKLIKDKVKAKEFTYLDERILSSSSIAIAQLKKETALLMDVAMAAFSESYNAFKTENLSAAPAITDKIERANEINQNITNFLIKLSGNSGEEYERHIADVYANTGDVIRIADIADNFIKYTRRTVESKIEFSDEVRTEIDSMVDKINALYTLTKQALLTDDKTIIKQIDEIEDTVDAQRRSIVENHIERLNNGLCKPESSTVFINLVSNIERMGDHLTYIAHTV